MAFLHIKKLKKKNGFTLIELVIVVAILAIIAAVAIPVISHQIENSKATVCRSNREMIKRTYLVESQLDETITIEKVLNNEGAYYGGTPEALCPAGGTIKIIYDSAADIRIHCTVHDKDDVNIGTDKIPPQRVLANMQYLIDNYKDLYSKMTDEEKKKYPFFYASNDNFRNYIRDVYFNGAYPTVTVNGVTLNIQPYTSAGFNTDQVLIYANAGTANGNWNANYFYDPREGVWYHSKRSVGFEGKTYDWLKDQIAANPGSWEVVSSVNYN